MGQESGFYLSLEGGTSKSASANVAMWGYNHPSRCHRLLYADPADAPTDAECTAPKEDGLMGNFPFESEMGLFTSVALGYSLGSVRVEVEAFSRRQRFDGAPFDVGDDAVMKGQDSEWSLLAPPYSDISEFHSLQYFGNIFYALNSGSGLTPYIGGGGGLVSLNFAHYTQFQRKSIAHGYLEAFGGSKSDPDAAPEWQRAAAGTMSGIAEEVSETAIGFQLVGGVDIDLGGGTSLGIQGRWTRVGEVSARLDWQVVYSHDPVHSDGRTPFATTMEYDGLGYMGLSLRIRHAL